MKATLIGGLHADPIGICAYQDLNSKSLIGAYTLHSNIYYMHEILEVHFFDRGEYIVVKVIGI